MLETVNERAKPKHTPSNTQDTHTMIWYEYREEKTDKARETEKRREQGWARQGQQDGGTGTVADRSRYERLIAPSACYMLDLLRVLTAS